jgi:hypothetical protein
MAEDYDLGSGDVGIVDSTPAPPPRDPFSMSFGPSDRSEDPFAVRQDLLQSPYTMATVVHAIVRDKYGDDAYWWDPLTVALELKADFAVDPCPEVLDRWNAIQLVMTGDAFFNRIDAFLAVCNSLSSGEPFFGAFDPVTTEEAAWAVAEVGMNRDMLPFAPTIKRYCKVVLENDGYGKGSFPPVFDIVFDDNTTLKDVKEGLVSSENGASLKNYLLDNVNDIASQFDSLKDLKNVDEDLLRKGLLNALRDNKDGSFQKK